MPSETPLASSSNEVNQADAAWCSLLAGAIAFCMTWVGLRLSWEGLGTPINMYSDALVYLAQAKSTYDNGWWWWNQSLGAPFGFNALAFPSNSNVDEFLVLALRPLGLGFAATINVAWLVAVSLGGASAAYCLLWLGRSRLVSIVLGVLFALSPYAVYRNIGHFSLVTYLVPFAACVAVYLVDGMPARTRSFAPLVVGCALLGFNYVYYAFFGCLLIAASSVACALAFRDVRRTTLGITFVALIGVTTAANLSPSLYVWSKEGAPWIVRQKQPSEADVYGLKIRHLISPTPHARWPLRAWVGRESSAKFPAETENAWARAGLVGAVAFLASVLALLAAPGERRPPWRPLGPGLLSAVAVACATIGGLGSLFNLLVTPEIRAWNRITPFIVFFSLAFLAAALDGCRRRWPRAGLVAVALTFCVGAWDQLPPIGGVAEVHAQMKPTFSRVVQDVGKIERILPPAAAVLQVPFSTYLNDAGRARMQSYESFLPYLASLRLRWSYPALSNRQYAWQMQMQMVPPASLAREAAGQGFSAILVDRYGYDDGGAAVTASLTSAAGTVVALQSTRYTLVDVRRVAPQTTISTDPMRPTTDRMPRCSDPPVAVIESIGRTLGPFGPYVPVKRGNVRVVGWVVHSQSRAPFPRVEVAVDGSPTRALSGIERADVAAALQAPQARDSGFVVEVPLRGPTQQSRSLTIRTVEAAGDCYHEVAAATLVLR